jgi:hypothetical protein
MDSVWRNGNISVYPNFIDTISSNYRLLQTSDCIDAGNLDTTGLKLPLTDIAGARRMANNRVDIGCYEFDPLFVMNDSFRVSPGIVNLNGLADSTFALSIHTNTSWSVTNKPDWVTIGNPSNGNPATLLVTATANPSTSLARTGKITFSRAGLTPPVQVQVNQTGSAFLNLIQDTIYVKSNQYDSAFIQIFSNIAWSANSYTGWLFLNPYYFFGNGTIKATATPNKSGASRIAQVDIMSNDYYINPAIKRRIIIIQPPGFYELCQNGSDSIYSGISYPFYQWQADTGAGFVNITDNAFYNGTNSRFLKLTNIPSSFNGFRFRCVAANYVGEYYSLYIQNKWQGLADNAWENPLNWACGILPDANTHVIISGGNVVVNANTTIKSLKISPTASIMVAPGVHLTILE